MKKSEVMVMYREKIIDTMVEYYEYVLNCNGRIQYTIYIWEDGEIEILEEVQGGNSWLKPREMETRELFCVCTIDCPFFDPWDCTDHSAPDDEEGREAERKEIIDWLVDEYKANVDDVFNEILTMVEEEEYLNDLYLNDF